MMMVEEHFKKLRDFIVRKVRSFFNQSYYIAKAWRYPFYWWKHRKITNPLILYQMGKVGSSTVARSLKRYGYDVFQVHVLRKKWIKRVEGQYIKASKDHGRVILDEDLLASMFVRSRLKHARHVFGEKPAVITLIRDPIARNISCFFEAFDIYFSDISVRLNQGLERKEDHVDKLIDLFLNKFWGHEVPLNWFDIHLKPVFGIDVYETNFPHEKGYQIYDGGDCNLLLIRLENLRSVAKRAFGEFLSIPSLDLQNVNIASSKSYFQAYDLFKDVITLPQEYIDHMYESRFMQHFYSAEEIDLFRSKWETRNASVAG